ncbi:corticotropin-releasing factor receptor 1 [Lingula anatina]|uniref:Corticotropin-releasing factor receptor 1 n=1 Tax=Lingula anatina TaxID=7574 RepID=A0A1S3IY53_LINAN|nr:corticotropin-releasing factor receptor 1 [Lingula anatina]XP_013402958.1 corticotropin-releasing factor receptor 1 [Lingula anatina]XP_013402965.1 corticotropin-releasing factor receptor 1 [Lingula anatina]|eukprot:XP_013402950.1 corticotropin-releasing factor receptor 1 [Lingula anatina]
MLNSTHNATATNAVPLDANFTGTSDVLESEEAQLIYDDDFYSEAFFNFTYPDYGEDLHSNHTMDSVIDAIAKERKLICFAKFLIMDPYPPTDKGQIYCNSTWTKDTCWPTTRAGEIAMTSCPAEVDGVRYDVTKNMTFYCQPNGSWAWPANVDQCKILGNLPNFIENIEALEMHNLIIRIIYFIGFGLSTIALLLALVIFIYFRSLRCLRNTIHCNLMSSFLLRMFAWIMLHSVALADVDDTQTTVMNWLCKISAAVYHYCTISLFFWMFVEGLHLHIMVFWAYSVDKLNIWVYAAFAWGVPVLFVITWGVVRYNLDNIRCWIILNWDVGNDMYDYIVHAPTLVAISVNLVFLFSIVWILISKIKSTHKLEARHYKKAVRTTIILMLLLGVAYIVVITPPIDDQLTRIIFKYCSALLHSTQGLCAAAFYCFMNGEVRAALTRKFRHWRDRRSISLGTRSSRASVGSRPSFPLVSPTGNSSSVGGREEDGSSKTIKETEFLLHRNSRDSNFNVRGGISEELTIAGLLSKETRAKCFDILEV